MTDLSRRQMLAVMGGAGVAVLSGTGLTRRAEARVRGMPPLTNWPGDMAYDNQTLFNSESFWRKPLPALDANRTEHASSTAWTKNLCAQMDIDYDKSSGPTPTTVNNPTPGKAWWGFNGNGVVYVVPADQPLVYVAVRDQVNTSPVYPQKEIPNSYELNRAFMRGVPIPDGVDARKLGTPDNCLVIYQPSTDRMWEFISLIPFGAPVADESNRDDGEGRYPPGPDGQPYTFTCNWGGYMEKVSTNVGVYQNRNDADGVQVECWNWGGSATSLPYLPGLITREECWAVWEDRAEDFGHALKITVGDAAASGILWPAQRSDGTVNSLDWVYEGARVFLPASADTSAAAYPQKLVRALTKTFQNYGGFVYDKTGRGIQPFEFRNAATQTPSVGSWPTELFLPAGAAPSAEIDPAGIAWAMPWHLMKVAHPSLSGGPS